MGKFGKRENRLENEESPWTSNMMINAPLKCSKISTKRIPYILDDLVAFFLPILFSNSSRVGFLLFVSAVFTK